MKRVMVVVLVSMLVFCIGGCSQGRSLKVVYPLLEYRNSGYNLDPFNREIQVKDGYILDEGNSYDVVETKCGYDIVLHFVEGGAE